MSENITEEIEYDGLFLNVDSTGNNIVTVKIKGRLETANSVHFLNFMTEVVDSSSSGCDLVLSLADLFYVSSTGIGAFTTILVNCKKKSMKLFLKDMQPKVKDILDLLGFSSFFNFC